MSKSSKKSDDQRLRSTAAIILVAIFAVLAAYIYYEGGYSIPSQEQSSGDILKINSKDDVVEFEYVSADEARSLLNESRARGEFKFLFPQIDLSNVDYIDIENSEITREDGKHITLLGVRGLSPDTKIYSNIDGVVRASAIFYNDSAKQPIAVFTGETDNYMSEFYIPLSRDLDDVSQELKGILEVKLGTPITDISDSQVLDKEIFPEGWQMALIVKSIGDSDSKLIDGSQLGNVLTREGRIIMIK